MSVKITRYICWLFFLSNVISAQTEKSIHGQIIVRNATPQNVFVVNLDNKNEAVTDTNGAFIILAKPNDVLVFSSVQLESLRKTITATDFAATVLHIQMVSKVMQLDQVDIDASKINAVDLRILPEARKSFTPAERRLKTAGDFKPVQLLGILGGSFPLDPVLNAINGRTKQLKKEVKIENKEFLMAKIDAYFEDDFFVQKMNIPAVYVKGFKYFLVDDAAFAEMIKVDKTQSEFRISQLAVAYLKLLSEDEKK